MGIAVDLVILLIILLSVFIGYKRGLIKVAVNILSFFIAVVIVLTLYKPVSNLVIENTQIDESIEKIVVEKFSSSNEENIEESSTENLPEVVTKYFMDSVEDVKNNVIDVVAENIAVTIINLGVAIVLFFGTKLVLLFVKALSGLIEKIPVIKQCNKIGGTLYGIISGLFWIYLILGVISLIIPLLNNQELIVYINNSIIGNIMYNNNILLNFILK